MWPLVSHLRQNRSHPGIVFHVERCIILLMESINTTGANMHVDKVELPYNLRNIVSLRGRILITQALILAIEELSKVEGAHRQVGNIADMQLILDSDFAIDTRD